MSSQNETRLSLNGRNAYIFLSGEGVQTNIRDPNYNKNYLTAKPMERARSCSPALPSNINNNNNKQSTPPSDNCEEMDKKEFTSKITNQTTTMYIPNITETNKQTEDVINKPQEQNSSESLKEFNPKTVSSNNGTSKGAIPKAGSGKSTTKPAGMLRYLSLTKRNLSPQKVENAQKKQKINDNPLSKNRYALLSDDNNDQVNNGSSNQKSLKPPPIFLRETSSNFLVNSLIDQIGKKNFT